MVNNALVDVSRWLDFEREMVARSLLTTSVCDITEMALRSYSLHSTNSS